MISWRTNVVKNRLLLLILGIIFFILVILFNNLLSPHANLTEGIVVSKNFTNGRAFMASKNNYSDNYYIKVMYRNKTDTWEVSRNEYMNYEIGDYIERY